MPDVLITFQGLRTIIEGKVDDQPGARESVWEAAKARVDEGIAHIAVALLYPASLRDAPFARLKRNAQLRMALYSETGETGWVDGNLNHLTDPLRRTYGQLAEENVVAVFPVSKLFFALLQPDNRDVRRIHPSFVLSTLLLLGAVAVTSFFLVRILTDDSSDEVARGQTNASPAPNQLNLILAEDAKKPRFVGEIQGIYISPYEESVPAKHRVPACSSEKTVQVPWDQAGQFALNVQLPPQFIFKPDDMNTGVIACEGGQVYSARWAYELPQPQFVNYPARLFIARGRSSWIYADASTDRVKTVDLGGRQAVVVEPVRTEGAGSLGQDGTQAAVSFPEPFGMTSVTATGVPLSDLLEVASIVGAATKN